MSWERGSGAEELSRLGLGWRGASLIVWSRRRGGDGVMWEKDGRREAVTYLEKSKRSLCYKAIGPLRLLRLI